MSRVTLIHRACFCAWTAPMPAGHTSESPAHPAWGKYVGSSGIREAFLFKQNRKNIAMWCNVTLLIGMFNGIISYWSWAGNSQIFALTFKNTVYKLILNKKPLSLSLSWMNPKSSAGCHPFQAAIFKVSSIFDLLKERVPFSVAKVPNFFQHDGPNMSKWSKF